MSVSVQPNKNVFKVDEDILLTITLRNTKRKKQKLLFDKPNTGTGRPWGTSGKLINITSNRSVLKYENRGMLSSQVYTQEDLEIHYYTLDSNQYVSKEFSLNGIVVFNESPLPFGTYSLQVYYYQNASNTVEIAVE